MLISSCAVVERMVTGCGGKLKAPGERRKILPRRPGKGTDGLSFFALGTKIQQQI